MYDAYRPQYSVEFLVRWVNTSSDERNKTNFYPRVNKRDLIKKGYLAEKSSHSRGSTVDMTLIKCNTQYHQRFVPIIRKLNGTTLPFLFDSSIDTGTGYDLMDEASHVKNNVVFQKHTKNRKIINDVMSSVGFQVLAEEWWHFTLKDEPFKNKYFNFPIE